MALESSSRAVSLSAEVSIEPLYRTLRHAVFQGSSVRVPSTSRWRLQSFSAVRSHNVHKRVIHSYRSHQVSGPTRFDFGSSRRSQTNIQQLNRDANRTHVVLKGIPLVPSSRQRSSPGYGDLAWFRLALRWRTPSNKVCDQLQGAFQVPNVRVNDLLYETLSSLPLTFLSSINMCNAAHDRALSTLSRSIHLLNVNRLSASWKRWISFRDQSRFASMHDSARKIQHLGRLRSSTRLLRSVRIAAAASVELQEQDRLKRVTFIRNGGRGIKCFMSHCVLSKRTAAGRRLHESALIAQEVRRAYASASQNVAQMTELLSKNRLAIVIQRVFRSMIVRAHSKQSKDRIHHSRAHARYQSAQSSADYNLEQHGAAQIIQTWLRVQLFCDGRVAQKLIWRSISVLQTLYRRQRLKKEMRARVRRRRQTQIELQARKRYAITSIQGLGRVQCARVEVARLREQAKEGVESANRLVQSDRQKSLMRSKLQQLAQIHPKAKRTLTRGIIRIQSAHRGGTARSKVASQQVWHVQR